MKKGKNPKFLYKGVEHKKIVQIVFAHLIHSYGYSNILPLFERRVKKQFLSFPLVFIQS